MVGTGVSTVEIKGATDAFHAITADRRVSLAALVRAHLADDTVSTGADRCGLAAVVIPETGHTVAGPTTEWSVATAAGVIRLVAGHTIPRYALAKGRVVALGIISAADTGRSSRPLYTERRIPTASSVIGHIADHALLIDTLLTIAVPIDSTLNAP